MYPAWKIRHHHWRSLTARTYAKSTEIHKPCVERRIKEIRKKISTDLKTCTDDKNIFGDNEHNKGVDNLQSIVKAAVNLDQFLWQQKAKFQIQWPPRKNRNPLSFDSLWMTGYETTKSDEERLMRERVVPNMYCVPALLECGTSEGNNYKEGVVISKALVDV
ncbi:hypothetical protein HYALB_00008994 [Hymenoscyphus albidus]|uniref:Uncharacterized protein n=1 Tax=Hymenoscyphus albidus TaxID=595503 RepID=A0A9N9LP30_9HELO|nr:hypothetical protein HYALB_00008994 [Hymenoscyphus albidus]